MAEVVRDTVNSLVCDQVTSVSPLAPRAQNVAVDVSALRTVSSPRTDTLLLRQLSHPHNRRSSLFLWSLHATYSPHIAIHISEAKPAGIPIAFLNKVNVSRWSGTEECTNFLRPSRTPDETVRFSLPCSAEGAAAPKATKAVETAMSLVKYISRIIRKFGKVQCLECMG